MSTLLVVVGIAMAAVVALAASRSVVGSRGIDRTAMEVADILERFVTGRASGYEWDDFISLRIRDPELQAIAKRCGELRDEYPPASQGAYTNAQGLAVIQSYIASLRRPRVRQQS